jgi:hypothetical protein
MAVFELSATSFAFKREREPRAAPCVSMFSRLLHRTRALCASRHD